MFRSLKVSSIIVGVFMLSAMLIMIQDKHVSIAAPKPVRQSSQDDNKALVRKFYDLFNSGNIDGLDAIVAADVVDHNPSPGQAAGLPGLKQSLQFFRSVLPDMNVKIEDLIAEGDKVVDRVTGTGTQKGQFLSIPPTGKQVSLPAIDIYRIANGKIVEVWHIEDLFGLMAQLAPAAPATATP